MRQQDIDSSEIDLNPNKKVEGLGAALDLLRVKGITSLEPSIIELNPNWIIINRTEH